MFGVYVVVRVVGCTVAICATMLSFFVFMLSRLAFVLPLRVTGLLITPAFVMVVMFACLLC